MENLDSTGILAHPPMDDYPVTYYCMVYDNRFLLPELERLRGTPRIPFRPKRRSGPEVP